MIALLSYYAIGILLAHLPTLFREEWGAPFHMVAFATLVLRLILGGLLLSELHRTGKGRALAA